LWYFKHLTLFTYHKNTWMNELISDDLYVLKDELVWYSRKDKKIVYKLKLKNLEKIERLDFGTKLVINKKEYLLRYIDNELLYIAFSRMFKLG
jgi:hypothetical protein